MIITFEELRAIKHKLPTGSVRRIAEELNINEQTVRNYFGANKFADGDIADKRIQPGPHGGIVHLEDTSILEAAQRILAESEKSELQEIDSSSKQAWQMGASKKTGRSKGASKSIGNEAIKTSPLEKSKREGQKEIEPRLVNEQEAHSLTLIEANQKIESQAILIGELQKEVEKLRKFIYKFSTGEDQMYLFRSHIYLDTDDEQKGEQVFAAFKDFLEVSGFEIVLEDKPISGSWIKNWVSGIKAFFDSEEVQEKLTDVEHALKLASIDKVQSEIDKNQAEAAANLVTALADVPSGVCQLGSIVLAKYTDSKTGVSKILVRTLTRDEMKLLQGNPNLINSPKEILDLLEMKREGEVKKLQGEAKERVTKTSEVKG